MQNLRLVTVDMVGTIIKFSKPPVQQYQDVAIQHGVKMMELNKIERSFFNQWKTMNRDFPHFGSTSGVSSKMWWIKLVKETFRDVVEDQYDEERFDKIAQELYSFYHSPEPYIVIDDGLEALKRLKDMKMKIGAISNFDNRLHDIYGSIGLGKFVDFVVTSEDARASKPEGAIFELAASMSDLRDLEPSEILHVGDDLEKDYHGARCVGWNCVLVDRMGANYSEAHVDHVVQNISQIFNIKEF